MLGIQKAIFFFSKFLSKIDVYSTNFNFRWSIKKKSLGSIFGGLLTLITSGLLVFLIYSSFEDIIYHQNPNSIYESKRPLSRPWNSFTSDNFSIYIGLRTEGMNFLKELNNNRFMDIWFNNYFQAKNSSGKWEVNRYSQPLHYCNEEELAKGNLKNQYIYCPKNKSHNIPLGGYWDEEKVAFLNIGFYRCTNSTENNNSCATQEEISQKIYSEYFYAAIYFEDKTLNLENYQNFASLKISNKYTLFTLNTQITIYIFLKSINIIIDSGLITSEKTNYRYVVYDYVESTFEVIEEGKGNVEFLIYASDKTDNYLLIYLKIIDVMSNIGGLMQIILFFISILEPLTHNRKYEEAINEVFSFYASAINKDVSLKPSNSLQSLKDFLETDKPNKINVNNKKDDKESINKKQDKSIENNDWNGNGFQIKLETNKKIDKEENEKKDDKIESFELESKSPITNISGNFLRRKSSFHKQTFLNSNEIEKKSQEKLIKLKENANINLVSEKTSHFENFLQKYFERKCRKEGNIEFSWKMWWYSWVPGNTNQQANESIELYKKGISYLEKTLNYKSYIKLVYDFEKLKMILLNKDQLALFNLSSKPVISLNSQISYMTEILEDMGDDYKVFFDIYKYFEKISRDRSFHLTDIEKKLISFLDFDLQVEVGEKFNCQNIFDQKISE